MAKTRSKTHIALLRGINVGGNKIVPMKTLTACLEALGYENVQTYIQSGNVVFDSPKKITAASAAAIAEALEKVCGVHPEVLLLSTKEFQSAVAGNPYPEAEQEPKTVHIYFLAEAPKAVNHEALEKVKVASERFHLAGTAFYLHTPDGIGKSKLALAIERHLGVRATARNWRTVQALLEMANDRPS